MAEDIHQKLKVALDEARMSIMGVQILIGFQFEAVVEDGFSALPSTSKTCVAIAMLVLVFTCGLLLLPAAEHRLADQGETTRRMIVHTSRTIAIALFFFAVGLGLDIYVAIEHVLGGNAGWIAGAGAFAGSILLWYGWMLTRPRSMKGLAMPEIERTPLSKKIDHMLTEARVMLPGAQALLGFALIAVVTRPFDELATEVKLVHVFGMAMLTITVILLIAPATVHRLAYGGNDTPEAYRIGSLLVTAASVPLAFGLAAGVFVAIGAIAGRTDIAAVAALATLVVLSAVWHGWPLALKALAR